MHFAGSLSQGPLLVEKFSKSVTGFVSVDHAVYNLKIKYTYAKRFLRKI